MVNKLVQAPLKTSRSIQSKLISLEIELKDKLKPFYLKMSRFGLPAETFQINDKLNFSIYGIIRKKIEQSYIIGLEAVDSTITKHIPTFELFMSVTDIDLIKTLSDSMMPQFWTTVTNLLQREHQIRQQKITLEDKNKFDVDAALTKLSSFIVYSGYNAAIDSKPKNILPGQRVASSKSRVGSAFTDFDPLTDSNNVDEAFGSDLSILDDLQIMLDNMQEMFLTKEDDRVCPICKPYDHKIWKIDDDSKPIPPDDLHVRCRCILVPVSPGE